MYHVGAKREKVLMKEAKTDLTPLKEILTAVLRDPQLPFKPDDALIWVLWDEVVGVTIARNAQPTWIKKGRLRVKVSDSIWLQELGFAENAIREKLNQRLGRKAIEKIEFRLTSR